MLRLVLDSGALIAFEKGKNGMRKFVNAPRAEALYVPANAVAEWWRSGTKQQRKLRDKINVIPLSEHIAELAGQALAWLDGQKEKTTSVECPTCGRDEDEHNDKIAIDATIMATAADIAGSEGTSVLYTGDEDDMRRFENFVAFGKVQILQLPT